MLFRIFAILIVFDSLFYNSAAKTIVLTIKHAILPLGERPLLIVEIDSYGMPASRALIGGLNMHGYALFALTIAEFSGAPEIFFRGNIRNKVETIHI